MKLLLVGGSVFIGRALVASLLADGHRVEVLNRGSRSVAGARQRSADRDDAEALAAALDGASYDQVIDVSCYTAQQARSLRGVLAGRCERWVHLSSASVYGDAARAPIFEDAPRGPSTEWGEYGLDKLAAEEELARLAQQDGIPTVILRAPYLYGPGNAAPRETWLWARILKGRPILVPEAGATQIQFLHTADLAHAVALTLRAPALPRFSAWNVGHPETHSFRRYIEVLGAAAKAPAEICEVPYRELGVRPRLFFPFRDYACVLDVSRIQSELGWSPLRGLEEGLAESFVRSDPSRLAAAPIDSAAEDRILRSIAAA